MSLDGEWHGEYLDRCMDTCNLMNGKMEDPLMMDFWKIWKTCNQYVFEGINPCALGTFQRIIASYDWISYSKNGKRNIRHNQSTSTLDRCRGFFDVASWMEATCDGDGAIICINEHRCLKLMVNYRRGTNSRSSWWSSWCYYFVCHKPVM